jgi:hypothetical protein
MLQVALEEGAVFIEHFFEAASRKGILAAGFGVIVESKELLEQQFLSRSFVQKVLLLEVAAKEGGADEALQHCVHVAGVADVGQP